MAIIQRYFLTLNPFRNKGVFLFLYLEASATKSTDIEPVNH